MADSKLEAHFPESLLGSNEKLSFEEFMQFCSLNKKFGYESQFNINYCSLSHGLNKISDVESGSSKDNCNSCDEEEMQETSELNAILLKGNCDKKSTIQLVFKGGNIVIDSKEMKITSGILTVTSNEPSQQSSEQLKLFCDLSDDHSDNPKDSSLRCDSITTRALSNYSKFLESKLEKSNLVNDENCTFSKLKRIIDMTDSYSNLIRTNGSITFEDFELYGIQTFRSYVEDVKELMDNQDTPRDFILYIIAKFKLHFQIIEKNRDSTRQMFSVFRSYKKNSTIWHDCESLTSKYMMIAAIFTHYLVFMNHKNIIEWRLWFKQIINKDSGVPVSIKPHWLTEMIDLIYLNRINFDLNEKLSLKMDVVINLTPPEWLDRQFKEEKNIAYRRRYKYENMYKSCVETIIRELRFLISAQRKKNNFRSGNSSLVNTEDKLISYLYDIINPCLEESGEYTYRSVTSQMVEELKLKINQLLPHAAIEESLVQGLVDLNCETVSLKYIEQTAEKVTDASKANASTTTETLRCSSTPVVSSPDALIFIYDELRALLKDLKLFQGNLSEFGEKNGNLCPGAIDDLKPNNDGDLDKGKKKYESSVKPISVDSKLKVYMV